MRKFLLVSLITITTLLSLTACGKKEENSTEESSNYATNEVINSETDSEEETTNDTEVISTVESTTEYEVKDEIYNTKDDAHVNDVKDINTISIDGNLIGFPCDYNYLSSIFTDLYMTGYVGKFNTTFDVDLETKDTEFTIYANPKTGEGTIRFLFKSDDNKPKTIAEMKCYEVYVVGGNTSGNKVMTVALPQNIKFGSTYENITNVFGKPNKEETSNGKTDFRLKYVLENATYNFIGYDGGLYTIDLIYE